MVLKWTQTKPEPLKYFEQELNLNPNRYLKRFDTLVKSNRMQCKQKWLNVILWDEKKTNNNNNNC